MAAACRAEEADSRAGLQELDGPVEAAQHRRSAVGSPQESEVASHVDRRVTPRKLAIGVVHGGPMQITIRQFLPWIAIRRPPGRSINDGRDGRNLPHTDSQEKRVDQPGVSGGRVLDRRR